MVRNGDLVVGPRGHATVEGEAKVVQDLGLAMREPYGVDRFHPQWGSMLPRYVGEPVNTETAALIKAEATRIVKNMAAEQTAQIAADAAKGARSRFSTSEIIAGVAGIDVRQEYDRFHVRVRIETLAGGQVQQTLTVEQ